MLRRYVGYGRPLRFTVHSEDGLVPGIRQREKTIRALLDGRFCLSEGDERKNEREQEQEKEARNSWTMHKRRLAKANQHCEARFFLLRTDRSASIEFHRRARRLRPTLSGSRR